MFLGAERNSECHGRDTSGVCRVSVSAPGGQLGRDIDSYEGVNRGQNEFVVGFDETCLVALTSWWRDKPDPTFLENELREILIQNGTSWATDKNFASSQKRPFDVALWFDGHRFFEDVAKGNDEEQFYLDFRPFLDFRCSLEGKAISGGVEVEARYFYGAPVLNDKFGTRVASAFREIREGDLSTVLGVAQGSNEPPKLIVLRYNGDTPNRSNSLCLLGKGITFDSGGLDIKSASGMLGMKGDMAGGASVIAAMRAIGILKPKINVVGIVPATENMLGSRAQRPGDVVRTMDGTSIEIGNTDAEGRLVLADAVAYARSIGQNRLVDVATLTGAMSVALGNICTGVFGNDQTLIDQVIESGESAGERFWQMPMFEEYKAGYRSDIADIKNTGGRGAGSITGAQFIGEFAGKATWAHLDIAATSKSAKNEGYNIKGATGVPVRTLVQLASNLARR